MKKLIFSAMAACFLLASCAKEDPIATVQEGNLAFDLSAVNQLSDGFSQQNTEFYSEEGQNGINDVKVYVFKKWMNQYVYVKTIKVNGWESGMYHKKHYVAEADCLPLGDYKFLAVGRDLPNDHYSILPILIPNITRIQDMTAVITKLCDESEIFAGCGEANMTDAHYCEVKIEMCRKVAGVLGYFKVPYKYCGTVVDKLRLKVSKSSLTVNLENGQGLTMNCPFEVIDVCFAGQPHNGTYYEGNTIPNHGHCEGCVKLPCTELVGKYILPCKDVEMTLYLLDAQNCVLKEWKVKSGNKECFDIVQNNLYELGCKPTCDNTKHDKPIDLLQEETITVTIDDCWKVIHNLTLEADCD